MSDTSWKTWLTQLRAEQLKDRLMGQRDAIPYAEIAEKLELTEEVVKVSVHRMRGRYREILREEIEKVRSRAAFEF